MCRSVLIATLALSACSSSHGREEEDGGLPPADGGVDTGPPPGVCRLEGTTATVRGTHACQRPEGVASGAPFELDVFFEGCYCGETFVCNAGISGRDEVAIHTLMCTPGATCDACGEGRVRCAMPALGVGTWRVTMNGEPAFELDVRPGGEAPSPTCWTAAPPVDDRALECVFPGESIATVMPYVCHADAAWPGQPATVRVVNPCAGCFAQPGPCRAIVDGNMVFLEPYERGCACDVCDCPAVCEEGSVQCVTPPLTAGVYDVVLGGNVVSRLTVAEGGSGAEVCAAGTTVVP